MYNVLQYEIGRYTMDEEKQDHNEDELWWEDNDEQDAPTRKRPTWALRIIALLVIIAFLGISLPYLPELVAGHFNFLSQNRELSQDELVDQARPAVVNVEACGGSASPAGTRRGSGFCVAASGIILTNFHVVTGAKQVKVEFADGQRFLSSKFHQLEGRDVAVVYLSGQNLPFLTLDTEIPAQPGDTVTTIGNPMGFERMAARGQVGAFYRQNSGELIFDITVTSRAGSSGSPVLNKDGRVVGIVYAITEMEINGKKEERTLAIPLNFDPEQIPVN